MNSRTLFSTLFMASLLAASAAPMLAADAPVEKVEFKVKLDTGGKPMVENAENLKSIPVSASVSIVITCEKGVDCKKVSAKFAGADVTMTKQDAGSAEVQLQLKTVAVNNLELFFDKSPILTANLQQSAGTAAPGGGGALTATDIAAMLQNPCTSLEQGSPMPQAGYTVDKDHHHAEALVAVSGRIIQAPAESIDERDTLTVWLLADSRLKSLLNVKRSSAIRTVGSFNIVGEGLTVKTGAQAAEKAPPPSPCVFIPFVLKDFAPGTGEVEIDTVLGTTTTKIASFDFVVDKLYRGMFSYAAISSDVVDRSFKLAPATQGSGNVIVASENGRRQLRYAVLVTIFAWGPRDIEKPEPLLHHINPCFGITVSNTTDNAIAGLSFDWNGFLIVGGLHYGRVTELAKGFQEGAAFGGAESAIPTTRRWKSGAFLGAAIDLRAAVSLLRTIASAPASGGK